LDFIEWAVLWRRLILVWFVRCFSFGLGILWVWFAFGSLDLFDVLVLGFGVFLLLRFYFSDCLWFWVLRVCLVYGFLSLLVCWIFRWLVFFNLGDF
jgi:hypothetical protein